MARDKGKGQGDGRLGHLAAQPIHPPGQLVVIHDAPLKRASWARHGVRGFYLGPALPIIAPTFALCPKRALLASLTLSLTSLTPSFPSKTSFPMPSLSPTPHPPAHIQRSTDWISSASLLWTLTSASALSSVAPHCSSFNPSPATSHPAHASHPVGISRCAIAPLTVTSRRPPSPKWLAGSGTSPHLLPPQFSHLSPQSTRTDSTSPPCLSSSRRQPTPWRLAAPLVLTPRRSSRLAAMSCVPLSPSPTPISQTVPLPAVS
jgi:hypothetical protein